MGSNRKILTVKEFVAQGGSPQFHVLARRKKGAVLNITVLPGVLFDNGKQINSQEPYSETLLPAEDSEGLIEIVQRISDDKIFHQGDCVVTKNNASAALISFSEDRIHCTVLDFFAQSINNKIRIPIDEIISSSEPDFDTDGEESEHD